MLGHIIRKNVVAMDPEKIRIIVSWPTPEKVIDIHRFIGMSGYYRKHVKDFSKVAAPLYNLFKQDVKWNWSDESNQAFKTLKEK